MQESREDDAPGIKLLTSFVSMNGVSATGTFVCVCVCVHVNGYVNVCRERISHVTEDTSILFQVRSNQDSSMSGLWGSRLVLSVSELTTGS